MQGCQTGRVSDTHADGESDGHAIAYGHTFANRNAFTYCDTIADGDTFANCNAVTDRNAFAESDGKPVTVADRHTYALPDGNACSDTGGQQSRSRARADARHASREADPGAYANPDALVRQDSTRRSHRRGEPRGQTRGSLFAPMPPGRIYVASKLKFPRLISTHET